MDKTALLIGLFALLSLFSGVMFSKGKSVLKKIIYGFALMFFGPVLFGIGFVLEYEYTISGLLALISAIFWVLGAVFHRHLASAENEENEGE